MKIQKTILAAALALASLASQASVTIGGYTFADNAFATYVSDSGGNFRIDGKLDGDDATKAARSLSDQDAYTGLFNSTDKPAFIDLRFDSGIVNGDGDDFVLFDLGLIDRFAVTINGVEVGRTKPGTNIPIDTFSKTEGLVTRLVKPGDGLPAGLADLNAVAIDLSLFGIAAGASVNNIRVAMDVLYPNPRPLQTLNQTTPTLSLAAALHTNAPAPVPEPETYAMLLAGLGAIGAAVRRRKQAK